MNFLGAKKHSAIWLYIIFGVFVLALLAWTSIRTLQETPSREASVQLLGQGWVTFRLTTDPYPPLSSGTIILNLSGRNRRGTTVDFGQAIPFAFGIRGSDSVLSGGEAVKKGSIYQAEVQFLTPGNYWLNFDLGDGNQVDFQVYVKPAQ